MLGVERKIDAEAVLAPRDRSCRCRSASRSSAAGRAGEAVEIELRAAEAAGRAQIWSITVPVSALSKCAPAGVGTSRGSPDRRACRRHRRRSRPARTDRSIRRRSAATTYRPGRHSAAARRAARAEQPAGDVAAAAGSATARLRPADDLAAAGERPRAPRACWPLSTAGDARHRPAATRARARRGSAPRILRSARPGRQRAGRGLGDRSSDPVAMPPSAEPRPADVEHAERHAPRAWRRAGWRPRRSGRRRSPCRRR